MTRRNPTSAEQTRAADKAPLNPRLLQVHGDARTKEGPVAPLTSVSVKGREFNVWPLVWFVAVALSAIVALIFLFG